MNKRTAAAAISLSLISGTALGASVLGPWSAGAQSTTTTAAQSAPSTSTAPDADDADREAQRGDRLSERLQPLVDNGTITSAQRDAVVAALAADDGIGGGHGRGHGGFGGSAVLAEALGMTEDELRQELSEGQSIAVIAAAQGVSVDTVVDALVTAATAKIDEAVAAGELTQAEADERKAELTERITAKVNGEMPANDGTRGPRGPFGPGAPTTDPAAPTTTGA